MGGVQNRKHGSLRLLDTPRIFTKEQNRYYDLKMSGVHFAPSTVGVTPPNSGWRVDTDDSHVWATYHNV